MSEPGATAAYESKAEAVKRDPTLVTAWLDAIAAADEEEKDWRKDADEAVKLYRAEGKDCTEFNIYHANIETLCPALYNSTPVPDVRRRYSDEDPTGKFVSDLLERGLAHSVDNYDFDSVMNGAVQDMAITDRGLARVRYVPYFGKDGMVAYEEAVCEHVPWKNFRRGPGRTWAEVPWVEFEHFLTKEEITALVGEEGVAAGVVIDNIPLNYTTAGKGESDDKTTGTNAGGIFKRARVLEIWDRENKAVLFICPDYKDAALSIQQDPLGLKDFFPIPRPMQMITSSDSLVPVVPLKVYRALLDELEELTERITKITRQVRARFAYSSTTPDIKELSEADDGEGIPITDTEMVTTGAGGLAAKIVWWPIRETASALETLIRQRDLVKQQIYEVTGIADILRGQTDPNETLGAQQIKAQWGSLRIQRSQREVARFARDLFRIKAEIMASKFSLGTFSKMTGIQMMTEEQKRVEQMRMQQAATAAQQSGGQQPPPQINPALNAPTVEDVESVLRDQFALSCRVDIESESTIRADEVRNQQAMAQFLQGTAQYAAAMAPLIQQNASIMPAAVGLYAAFSRHFNLGKSAEDELDKLIKAASQPPPAPQAPPPDPKAQGEAMTMKAKGELLQLEMTATREKIEGEMRLNAQKIEIEERKLALKEKEIALQERATALKGILPIAQTPGAPAPMGAQ